MNSRYLSVGSWNIEHFGQLGDDNDENHYAIAQHIELAYEIPFGELHIGPQIDIGIEEEGIHYMFGVHLGIDF